MGGALFSLTMCAVSGTLTRPLLLAAAGILVFWNAIANPFVFDDFGAIVNNTTIRQVNTATLTPPEATPVSGRPLANLSFAISYALGGMDPSGFRALNLAIHIACAILLMSLAGRTLVRSRVRDAAWLAFAIALLWLVHPINSEPVDYLTERTESLMALCFLAAMYAAARSHDDRHPARWAAIAVAAAVAGVFAKETIAVVPILVIAWDRAFVFPSVGAAFRARWRLYAALSSVWILLAINLVRNGQTFSAGFATAGVTPWVYLLNQPAIVLQYLKLVIWPAGFVNYYGWPVQNLTVTQVWPAGVVIVALLALAVVAIWKWPRGGFAGLWFWLILAPTSSIIPIATEVGAERRMYLPVAALLALLVVGGAAFTRRNRISMSAAAASLAIVAGLLSWRTIERNREYSTPLRLAETTLARWPSPNAHNMMGVELAAAGRHQEAVVHLREAAKGYPTSHYFLGSELLTLKQHDEAIAELQAFVEAEPNLVATGRARLMMATAFIAKHDPARAIAEAERVLAADPNNADAHGMLANLLAEKQEFAAAVPHYQRFLAARPGNAAAWTGLGVALVAAGDLRTAVSAFQRAADLEPGNPQYQSNLARAIADANGK
jgi:Flp pilus assembly protein TadD